MPSLDEIERRFGLPNEKIEWRENLSYRGKRDVVAYRQFTEAEMTASELAVIG
jgi:hypothetical protein